MKITIPYRRMSRLLEGGGCALCALLLLTAAVHLLREGIPAGVLCAMIALVCFIFVFSLALQAALRAIFRTGCFSITSDGLENLVHPLTAGPFRYPVNVRLVPWSCIDSFRIDRSSGGDRIMLIPKDEADFPKGYSRFARWLLEREHSSGDFGFYFDSRRAAVDPEALLRLLQKELAAYRGSTYPAGWPEPGEMTGDEKNGGGD